MAVELLDNKHLSTRFQILVEIAAHQPSLQQKDIAVRLDITPQSVSKHIKQLIEDGLLISSPRSRLKISPLGIDWMIRQLNTMQEYFKSVEQVIWNIRMSPALADANLSKGQKIGLIMRDGQLLAADDTSGSATGVTVSSAKKGEAVGVINIQGIIDMEAGGVNILEIPSIRKGSLRPIDIKKLKKAIGDRRPIAYIGIEAMAVLNLLKIEPDIDYAGKEAMVDAVRRGVSPVIVCVDEELPALIKYLEDTDVGYSLLSFNRLK